MKNTMFPVLISASILLGSSGTQVFANNESNQIANQSESNTEESTWGECSVSVTDGNMVIGAGKPGSLDEKPWNYSTKSIRFDEGFDSSCITDMSLMFSGCNSLTSLDLSSFDTSNVTNMSSMFAGCSSLTSLDVSGFDTSKVKYMTAMFYLCSELTNLDLSNFDTSNATDMRGIFWGCTNLVSLDISGFDTGNVVLHYYGDYIKAIFSHTDSLTQIKLSKDFFKWGDEILVVDPSFTFENWYYPRGEKSGWFKLDDMTVSNMNPSPTDWLSISTKMSEKPEWWINGSVLKFNTNGGSSLDPVSTLPDTILKINLSEYSPEWEGHTFAGWYTDANLQNQAPKLLDLRENTIVYAKWTNTLTFAVNGGSSIDPITLPFETEVNLNDYRPIKAGYTFAGWYSDIDLTNPVTTVKLTNNTTVYAKWEKKSSSNSSGSSSITAGLVTSANGVRYRNSDGTYAANTWKTVDGKTYYFGADTYAITGKQTIGGSTYFFNSNGIMQSGWQSISGKEYYFNTDGKMVTGIVTINGKEYEFGTDGVLIGEVNSNKPETPAANGWKETSSGWIYLDSNGKKVTGWQKLEWEGKANWYLFNDQGDMLTGWHNDGGKWYFLRAGGEMATGWVKTNNTWYYCDKSGVMVTGWQKIDGIWYFMDSSGAMKTGWLNLPWNGENNWYFFYDSGEMAANTTIGVYRLDSSGKCLNPDA